MTTAGNLIWLARDASHLTQTELADRAGVPQSTISSIERGHRQPSVEFLIKIIQAAGLDLRLVLSQPDQNEVGLDGSGVDAVRAAMRP